MMHTKTAAENLCVAPQPARAAAPGHTLPGPGLPALLEHWLMPWARLRMTARDGGPPQWPMPWR